MGDFGKRLKQERQARDISLEQIARETRIGVRLLQAIEDENFEQLPGGIFNKSFIRQYAQCLGLDEEAVVREYLRATGAAREPQLPQLAPETSGPRAASSLAVWMAAGLATLMLVIAGAWLLLRSSNTAGSSPSSIETAAVPAFESGAPLADVDNPPPAEPASGFANQPAIAALNAGRREAVFSAPERSLNTSAELNSLAAESLPTTGIRHAELNLKIHARSTVWISITADGERQWQGTLQPDQSREVQASETIRLTVGNAGGVVLLLNGEPLDSLGNEGEVRTITLAARAPREAAP